MALPATATHPDTVREGRSFLDHLKDSGAFGIGQILVKLTSLITLPVLIKTLGEHDYGRLATVNAASGLLVWVVLWSLPSATVRFLAGVQDRTHVARVHSCAVLVIVGSTAFWLGILSAGLSVWGADALGDPLLPYLAMLLSTFTALVSLFMTSYRIRDENRRYVSVDMAFTVLNAIVLVTAVLYWQELTALLIALVGFKAVRSIWLTVQFTRHFGFAAPDWEGFKPFWTFSLPLLFPQAMAWMTNLSDRLIIGIYHSQEVVGIYAANYNLSILVNHLTAAVFFAFTPTFSRLWSAGDTNRFGSLAVRSANAMLAVGLPVVVAISCLSPLVMSLLATGAVAQASLWIVPFVAVGLLLNAFAGYGGEVMMLNRLTGRIVLQSAVGAGTNLILNIILVPVYPLAGAAIATLLSFGVLFGTSIVLSRAAFRLRFDLGFALKVVISAAFMTFCFELVSANLWHRALIAPIAGATYVGSLYVLSGMPTLADMRAKLETT
ncbi:MAG: hypothetical protein CME19_17260 [Gemmatimonadetes bacterium]|nr:hypothetical protein [Gemmatimonadota bacterium]